ncbi:MAG: hypothetical protein NT014_07030 [Candidatus Omnitrophica bacterium]|nr:hypothetical protein [Candidatus Omnitrophota bacterium]
MTKIIKALSLSTVIFLLTGCISSRGFKIDVPQNSMVKPNGIQVYIRSIQDNREFQVRPRSADIPSFGSKKNIGNPQIQCRTIGRQRNGYGKALGNVFLSEDQKIETVVYEAIKSSLNSLGYEVTDSRAYAKENAIILDVAINKFWSWINMGGGWSMKMDSEVETVITLASTSKKLVITGTGRNHYQVASSANWKKVMELAVKDYISQANDKLNCLPDNC